MATVVHLSNYLVKRDASRVMVKAGMRPDSWQKRLLRRRPHRLLVTTSRQSGKSTSCAGLGLHRAVVQPEATIVAVSPTQRQSTLLIRKVRAFAKAVGVELVKDNALSLELVNGSVIYALPGSPDTVRGYSPHLLMIDEAAYTTDALYTACLPMLAATGGDLVCVSTPNGQRGWFWAEWDGQGAAGWERIEVPYTEISRITPEFIAGQKASMSRERFAAEYECRFNSSTFGLFSAADLDAAMQREPIAADGTGLPDAREIIARNRQRLDQAKAAS
ncbi:terminase large subunit domain-containing protein [Amycolatopsis sp.]|uniref:terminase large subunit domain-containing protein n=1 Tax=Amycolatopsis sp. TaxID=37632 RepID=UPI002D80CA49|nr:terminase large subunit [Amycolatopsis sp.]HET6711665.1 terminase large subunit [Amycolatopsis sp.]